MRDRNDAETKWPALRDALRETLPSELDSSTVYQPAFSQLAPSSSSLPEQRKPRRNRGLFARLMQFLVPRRRHTR